MGKLRDRLERLMFGYTAEERADITRRYVDWRTEQVIVGSLERLTAEDEAEDQAQRETAREGRVQP